MKNLLVNALAVLGLLIGLASMVTPIPGGTLLILVCLSVLILSSKFVQSRVLSTRTKVGWINRLLLSLEGKTGDRLRLIRIGLKKTDPARKDRRKDNSNQEFDQELD